MKTVLEHVTVMAATSTVQTLCFKRLLLKSKYLFSPQASMKIDYAKDR